MLYSFQSFALYLAKCINNGGKPITFQDSKVTTVYVRELHEEYLNIYTKVDALKNDNEMTNLVKFLSNINAVFNKLIVEIQKLKDNLSIDTENKIKNMYDALFSKGETHII